MRRASYFLLFLILLPGRLQAAAGPAALIPDVKQDCLKKVCFETEKEINGMKQPLRGMGLLEYLGFDMYTGALYAPSEAQSIEAVLGDVPKSLVLHYHRGIKIEWMNKAAEKILQKNPNIHYAEIEERVKQIGAAYKKVKKNDRYELTYVPGTGTSLFLNDEHQITIPGEDFARAYLGIWISEYPANKGLRDRLLGIRKE